MERTFLKITINMSKDLLQDTLAKIEIPMIVNSITLVDKRQGLRLETLLALMSLQFQERLLVGMKARRFLVTMITILKRRANTMILI